jgi:hypothetical protein
MSFVHSIYYYPHYIVIYPLRFLHIRELQTLRNGRERDKHERNRYCVRRQIMESFSFYSTTRRTNQVKRNPRKQPQQHVDHR